jgi:hypothetical protein
MLLRAGLALLFLLSWPAMARATVLCVGTAGATCTVTSAGSAANLQGALTSAQGGGADTIRIGPGTFTSPTDDGFTYAADQSISIDGSGASTILQGNGAPGNATALSVDADGAPSSTISDLTVRKSGSGFPLGLKLSDGRATDVPVTEAGARDRHRGADAGRRAPGQGHRHSPGRRGRAHHWRGQPGHGQRDLGRHRRGRIFPARPPLCDVASCDPPWWDS